MGWHLECSGETQRVKVLYLAGPARVGSTVLGQLLGEVEGFINLGEAARFLFSRQMRDRNLPCGCGRQVEGCEFWNEIVADVDPETIELGSRLLRIRNLPRLMVGLRTTATAHKLERLAAEVGRVFRRILDASNSQVIVDSSKHPATAWLLSRVPGVELHTVHLLRDPGAVVASGVRTKAYLDRRSAAWVTRQWVKYNVSTELVRFFADSYRQIKYADFVLHPKAVIRELAEGVTGGRVALDFIDGRSARIGVQHPLAGNPCKLQGQSITIAPQPWTLPLATRILVRASTLPVTWWYGRLAEPGVFRGDQPAE